MDQEKLFDLLYDMRYSRCAFNRYSKTAGASSERETLRPLISTPGLGVFSITSPSVVSNKITGGSLTMKYSNSHKPLQCMMTNSSCYKGTRKMDVKGILWHSTGANNPNLKRYVQPSENDVNYTQLMNMLGKNQHNNDWNHTAVQAGLNCWIGKLADGSVTTVQTMPWDYRPWGCGSGAKGSCNNGWIQFEICEDSLTDANYFAQVYKEACEITAYLCEMFDIDPHGTVNMNGVQVPTILCHADSYKLGLGSNHGDVNHWFPKYGKSMATVRDDVAALMTPKTSVITPVTPEPEKEDDEMTQEKFNEMMNVYLTQLATKDASPWSAEARAWCEANGIINGDASGNKMYKKFLTREELAAIVYRLHGKK